MKMKTRIRVIMKDKLGGLYHIDISINLASTMQYLILREVGEWLRTCENMQTKGVDVRGLTLYGIKVLGQRKENGEELGGAAVTVEKSSPLVVRNLPYVPSE